MIKVMHFAKSTRSVRNGLIVVMLSAFAMVSCSKESKLATHIPKDATGVVSFNVKSLALKSMDFKELMSVDNLKKVFTDLDDSVATAIRNSGIDLLNKAYIFGKSEEAGQPYGAAILALTDAAKFEEFVKKANKNATITKEGAITIASFDEKAILGWNETELIILIGSNDKEKLMNLVNLKKEESLAANNDTFKDLEGQEADVAFFLNFEPFEKYGAQTGMPMANFNLKETFMTATCNFEDGQVVVDTKYTGNDEMVKKFNFMKGNVGDEVIAALPGKTVIGMASFAIDMDKVYTYLEGEKLTESVAAPTTQMTGLTVKEALSMFTGDMAATVNGVTMKEVKHLNWGTGEEYIAQEPEFDYLAVLGIANKENAGKVLNTFVEQGMLTKEGNVYSFQGKIFIVEKGNTLSITGSESLKQFAIDGSGEKLNSELAGLMSGNGSTMYVNLSNIPETFYQGTNAPMGEHVKNIAIEDITATGSALNGKTSTGHFVVRFKAKDENSLLTITKIAKKYGDMIPLTPTPSLEVIDTAYVDGEPVVVANE
jgi:hypothetical protein